MKVRHLTTTATTIAEGSAAPSKPSPGLNDHPPLGRSWSFF